MTARRLLFTTRPRIDDNLDKDVKRRVAGSW
jgi:hypothetical protein